MDAIQLDASTNLIFFFLFLCSASCSGERKQTFFQLCIFNFFATLMWSVVINHRPHRHPCISIVDNKWLFLVKKKLSMDLAGRNIRVLYVFSVHIIGSKEEWKWVEQM